MLSAHELSDELAIQLLKHNLREVGEKFTDDMVAVYQAITAGDARALLLDSIRLHKEITIENAGIIPEFLYGERKSA